MATKRDRTSGEAETPLTFEQALSLLEGVVRTLEDGQIGLDESLAKYEEGVRLLQTCRESLQNAERKIMLLTGIDPDGNPIVEPFGEESTTLDEKRESRVRRRSRSAPAPPSETISESEDPTDTGELDRQRGLF